MRRILRALLGLALVGTLALPIHAQEVTITEILNACYDPVTETLRAARWMGAPGSGLTPTQIFNAVYVPAAGAEQAYMRFREIIRGTTPPATCAASDTVFLSTTDATICICTAAGDAWHCSTGGEGSIVTTLCELNDVSCIEPAAHGDVLTYDSQEDVYVFAALPETVVADGSITTAKLGDGAVTTVKLSDANVTNAKLDTVNGNVGTFGSTSQSVQIAVNAQGRITAISNQEISGIPTGSVGPAELASTAVTPGECGDATHFCVPDIDEDGRIVGTTVHEVVAGSVPSAIEAESVKLTPVVETTSCNMAFANHHVSPTGTTTCTLPAAATDTVGTYNFFVMNSNSVVIAKTGADKINDVSASMAAVAGPLSRIQCTNTDNVDDWRCEVITKAGYGATQGVMCAAVDGGQNDSSVGFGTDIVHTLECDIPAGKLTTGSTLETCSGWQITTGTTPPTLTLKLRADAVVLAAPAAAQSLVASATRNVTTCYTTVIGEAPSTASASYTAPVNVVGAFVSGSTGASATSQPLDLNTTAQLTIRQTSQFTTAGTGGPHTIRQLFMTVKGSGLLP